MRIEKGLTQKQLAEYVLCDQSMIARWERGQCEPTASAIVRLADALNCSCDFLLGKSDD